MEQNKSKNSNFMPLLINALKGKGSWFFLSTVVIFVTTLLIPFILRVDEESFVMVGVVEVFAIVFINCLIDNSFLHNDSKLAYYKSKPVSLTNQITIIIITNIVLTAFLLILISLSIGFQGLDYELFQVFKIITPWLVVGIFLTSLSSILTGNTLMAGAMTIFNFCLPLIIYLIILFIFTILENIVVGFGANIFMDYFVNAVYNLEYIYFVEYYEKSIDFVYVLVLGIMLVGITLLIYKCLKRRKNENTGNFIVFDGFKYFVSVLASLIVPATFSIMSYGDNIVSKITVSILMAILSYYIIIAVIEKSFRISRLSMKIFVGSMAVFVVVTGATVSFAKAYEDVVPEVEKVRMAYAGRDSGAFHYIEELGQKESISQDELLELQKNRGIVVFTEKKSIENIIELQKELILNQNYNIENYYNNDLIISYLMNDGSVIIRDYSIKEIEDDYSNNGNKDELANKIINSDEFKMRKYYYLYDKENYNSKNLKCNVYSDRDGILMDNVNIDHIRDYLIEDINVNLKEVEKSFGSLTIYNYNMFKDNEAGTEGYYLEITGERQDEEVKREVKIDSMNLEGFENTLNYLKISE